MCPLRFILIFFSAVLAAYFAWTTVSSTTPEIDFAAHNHDDKSSSNKGHFSFIQMIKNGFWVLVDMASGRYLWKNLRSTNNHVQRQNS
ncbi:hypothetical protein MtrunA17_Chr7g0253291 [Medicago truncatula]|uniref:Methyltransferase-like protein n=1 Tax=Medicago truncatula TaxID=3880 RepID=A0A072U289_MEDTR|nr:uncharacterized protein LOC25498982 [Medicago truncatula]KEH23526.1 methyltransferase-like protein [Medicago truncatula]RHN47463.1 hypothetical protein MtrunA17_Chr7g0253291 [Medicago truncatula]